MNVIEASRQWQCALETARRARTELAGVESATDILNEVAEDAGIAYVALERAWAEHEISRELDRIGMAA